MLLVTDNAPLSVSRWLVHTGHMQPASHDRCHLGPCCLQVTPSGTPSRTHKPQPSCSLSLLSLTPHTLCVTQLPPRPALGAHFHHMCAQTYRALIHPCGKQPSCAHMLLLLLLLLTIQAAIHIQHKLGQQQQLQGHPAASSVCRPPWPTLLFYNMHLCPQSRFCEGVCSIRTVGNATATASAVTVAKTKVQAMKVKRVPCQSGCLVHHPGGGKGVSLEGH